ncbi:hypothetical protein [Prescottella equi]
MSARKVAAAAALAAVAALALTGCDSGKPSNDESLKPYIQVTPSGAEVVCTWKNWNGRNGNEWDCEVVHG